MSPTERNFTTVTPSDSVMRESKSNHEILQPSNNLAWMLGILSGGGSVSIPPSRSTIYIEHPNQQIISKFKNVGEEIFHLNANSKISRVGKDGKHYTQVKFYSVQYCNALGDLRYKRWSETIISKHSWILTEPNFVWSFLTGYLDVKGHVMLKPKRRIVKITTTSKSGAIMLAELLTAVGVRNPKLSNSYSRPEGIEGVEIAHIEDLVYLAKHIQLTDPDQDKKLDYYRNLVNPRIRSEISSNEEVIREWRKLTQLLGNNPSSHDIDSLRKQRRTKFSSKVYKIRFGNGSFTKAKDNLRKMTKEESPNDESAENHQIFP